ncbi:MAG: hypothetical protein JWP73_268, partial [Phenylobacterium sp.]|nr:hypothetical protein [Phenylobacterium sp.]
MPLGVAKPTGPIVVPVAVAALFAAFLPALACGSGM